MERARKELQKTEHTVGENDAPSDLLGNLLQRLRHLELVLGRLQTRAECFFLRACLELLWFLEPAPTECAPWGWP